MMAEVARLNHKAAECHAYCIASALFSRLRRLSHPARLTVLDMSEYSSCKVECLLRPGLLVDHWKGEADPLGRWLW